MMSSTSQDSLLDALIDEHDGEASAATPHAGAADSKPKVKKARRGDAHAKYMRFYRSITTNANKTPPCVLEKVAALNADETITKRGKLLFLFEDWAQSAEDWGRSTLVINHFRKTSQKKRGALKWMNEGDLLAKYHGNTEAVADLVARKLAANQVRDNPDFPGVETQRQYLCFDSEAQVTEDETGVSLNLGLEAEVGKEGLKAMVTKGVVANLFQHGEASGSANGKDPLQPKPKPVKPVKKEKSDSEKMKAQLKNLARQLDDWKQDTKLLTVQLNDSLAPETYKTEQKHELAAWADKFGEVRERVLPLLCIKEKDLNVDDGQALVDECKRMREDYVKVAALVKRMMQPTDKPKTNGKAKAQPKSK